jgi:hypothetical protein
MATATLPLVQPLRLLFEQACAECTQLRKELVRMTDTDPRDDWEHPEHDSYVAEVIAMQEKAEDLLNNYICCESMAYPHMSFGSLTYGAD